MAAQIKFTDGKILFNNGAIVFNCECCNEDCSGCDDVPPDDLDVEIVGYTVCTVFNGTFTVSRIADCSWYLADAFGAGNGLNLVIYDAGGGMGIEIFDDSTALSIFRYDFTGPDDCGLPRVVPELSSTLCDGSVVTVTVSAA